MMLMTLSLIAVGGLKVESSILEAPRVKSDANCARQPYDQLLLELINEGKDDLQKATLLHMRHEKRLRECDHLAMIDLIPQTVWKH